MKKVITIVLVFAMLICLCACTNNSEQKMTKAQSPTTQTRTTQAESADTGSAFYGTWEITGIGQFSDAPSNSKIYIDEEGMSFCISGVETESVEYVESYDSEYAYLEFEIESSPYALVMINQDMIGLLSPLESGKSYSYKGVTPWGMEYDAEIDVFNIYMRQNSGTKSLPSYMNIDKLVEDSEFSEYTDYIYYPNAQVLQLYGYGLAYFYTYTGGGGEYMEAIALELSNEKYDSSDIFTANGFVITDNK